MVIMPSDERGSRRESVVISKISATCSDLMPSAETVVELRPHRRGNGRS